MTSIFLLRNCRIKLQR